MSEPTATALDRPYCTVADVQEITGNAEPESDELFRKCVNRASRLVDERCGRDFWFHDHTDTPYQPKRKYVVGGLVALPFEVLTLTAVTIDGVPVDMASVLWDAGEPLVRTSTGVSWGHSSMMAFRMTDQSVFSDPAFAYGGDGNVLAAEWLKRWDTYPERPFQGTMLLTGTFGFPLAPGATEGTYDEQSPPPTLPSGVVRAASLIAAALSGEWRKERIGLDGQRDTILETRIPQEVDALLKRWVIFEALSNF